MRSRAIGSLALTLVSLVIGAISLNRKKRGRKSPVSNPVKSKENTKKRIKWGWINTSIVAALITFAGAIIPFLLSQGPSPSVAPSSQLHLDSLSVIPHDTLHPGDQYENLHPEQQGGGGPDALDFKIRNVGSQLALITGIRIGILGMNELLPPPPCLNCSPLLPISAVYGTELPLSGKPQTISVGVSEQVGPDQADRFDLNLSLPRDHDYNAIYVYKLSISILYNENKSLNAGDIIIALPETPTGSLAQYLSAPYPRKCTATSIWC